MIRLVGAVLLTVGSATLGFGAVNHLEGRVHDLRELMAGVETLQRELGWRLAPLPEALSRAAKGTNGRPSQFFKLCAQSAAHLNGRTFQQIWQEGVEASQMRLEREDLEVLEQLGLVLGRYDGDSQQRALEVTGTRLEQQRTNAAEQRARLGRVYSMLGITAGLFLVILLI